MTMETQTLTFTTLTEPQNDTQLLAFYNEALGLLSYAEARVIRTAEDLKPASDDLTIIARLKKAMEGRRKDYLQPFQDHIKEVSGAYKRLMSPVESADRVTREKILAFNAEQERKRREQEEINRLRMEAAKKEMELKGELTESVNLVEVLPPTPTRTQTDMGSAGLMKVRKWEVEDLSKVPLDYLMIDAAKVGKVVRAGIPSIPGIRIWLEDSLRVTPSKA